MARKYYVTDFYNDILKDIGEGKYWFAVEERVRKEYPHPEKILEFLTADHIPLGFDAYNQVLFPRTMMCDFAPLFPLFNSREEAREMINELVNFYANLHWREFLAELKRRGKKALFKEFCLAALELAEKNGWKEAEMTFVVEESPYEKDEVSYSGSLREIEEFILEGTAFPFLINTYLDPEKRVLVEDENTIKLYPFLRTIPDVQGYAYLKKID